MRRVFSVTLYGIAGFFFFTVSFLSFNSQQPRGKWWIMAGFMVPAVLALCGGLALKNFRDWKRTTGIVLLSSAGGTAFLIFTLVCTLMTKEFQKMVKPSNLASFSDYFTGGAVIVSFAVLGLLFFKAHEWGSTGE